MGCQSLTSRGIVAEILREKFDDVVVAMLDLGCQEQTPVVEARGLSLKVVLPLADQGAHVGPLLLQQRLLRLRRVVQGRQGLGRQLRVAPQVRVQTIRMLPQIVLLGAVQLLPRGLSRRHVTGHVSFQRRARFGRLLKTPRSLLQGNDGRLQQRGPGRLQVSAPIFAFAHELVGRRFDDVVELAALLLRLLDRVRQIGAADVDATLDEWKRREEKMRRWTG